MKKQPARKPESSIKNGDLFVIGKHRLLCGSACSKEDVARLIGKEKIAAVISDPPYGVSVVASKLGFSKLKMSKDIENDDISSESEYAAFSREWLDALKPHLASKNSVYIFNSDRMIFALHSAMQWAGFTFSQLLVWAKQQAVIGRKDYLPMHELIAFGWFGRHQFVRSKDKSVIVYPKPNKSPHHPTSKPVGLLRKLILNSTRIGEIVYDPFVGGGSTGLAAEQTGRRCFMIEIDPEHCATTIFRLERLSGLTAKRITK